MQIMTPKKLGAKSLPHPESLHPPEHPQTRRYPNKTPIFNQPLPKVSTQTRTPHLLSLRAEIIAARLKIKTFFC